MNRLFWKILVAFWLTLVVVSLVVGYAVRAYQDTTRAGSAQIEGGPRTAMVLDSAEATLRHGGLAAMQAFLAAEHQRMADPVYAVDASGRDLLGRTVPPAVLAAARREREQPAAGSPSRTAVRELVAGDSTRWLLFVAPRELREPAFGGPLTAFDPTGALTPRRPGGFPGDGGPPRGPGHDRSPREPMPREFTPREPMPREFMPPDADGREPPPRDGRFGGPGGPPPRDAGPGAGREGRDDQGGPPRDALRRSERRTGWLQVLAGLLASLGFSAALAWYLTRPVRTLRTAFDAAANGRLDVRVQPMMGRRRDEIADLGADFDRMVQQVQNAFDAQRRLLHDVSHELRSPLARLQVATGLARQNPARLGESLDRIDLEASRLDRLIDQVLTLARLESDANAEAAVPTDLVDLVSTLVADARFETANRDIVIDLQAPPSLLLPLRAELLHRAIENVLRNAIKFGADDGRIGIRIAPVPDMAIVRIEIADHGPGVPADQLATLFAPFRRGRNARGVEGYGLGLAIASQAVRLHAGEIRALPRDGGGLIIRIDLPMPG